MPFGQVRTSASPITQTDFAYTGQRNLDAQWNSFSLGLMDYNARFYDPSLGRFTQPDTLTPGGPQGLNRYSYTLNNPINFNDPSGHCVGEDGTQLSDTNPECMVGGTPPSTWNPAPTATTTFTPTQFNPIPTVTSTPTPTEIFTLTPTQTASPTITIATQYVRAATDEANTSFIGTVSSAVIHACDGDLSHAPGCSDWARYINYANPAIDQPAGEDPTDIVNLGSTIWQIILGLL